MKPENISARLRFILSLSERWERDGVIADIDRDVILEYLRSIYTEVSAAETVSTHHAAAPLSTAAAAAVAVAAQDETAEPATMQPADEPAAATEVKDAEVDMVIDDDILSVAVGEETESETFATPEPEPIAEPAPESEPIAESVSEPKPEPDTDAAEQPAEQPASEPKADVQPETANVPEAESAPAAQPEPAVEPAGKPAAEPTETLSRANCEVGSLFDLGGVDRSRKRSIVMSLYGASPAPPATRPVAQPEPAPAADAQNEEADSEPAVTAEQEPAPTPQPEAEPEAERIAEKVTAAERVAAAPVAGKPTTVLGEVIVSGVKTVADAAPRVERVAESLPVTDLHTAINLNDKFTMIRDLFGGDVESYNRTIARLNGMRSLDEALFYIGKNFAWKAESEGARLLMDVLQRRYGR